MKKLITTLVAAFALMTGAVAVAAEGGMELDAAPARTNDMSALQNGAKLFVNYCLNCHSASFMRYNRMRDIGLTEEQIKTNLMFATDKVGETMKVAIDPKQAKEWFGATPPDLTVIARSRAGHGGSGADYIYTYLRTYYRDDSKATGWNNMAFPSVAMPNVLWELQGQRSAKFVEEKASPEEGGEGGEAHLRFAGFEQITPGTLTPLQFDESVGDLVAFIEWMGEPAQNQRFRIGVGVMIFLTIFILITWRLNASFWRQVT
jgi:ubiquinol-cytochrome c reductase cytochrome c1 subunit